jgi:hypothetical protein
MKNAEQWKAARKANRDIKNGVDRLTVALNTPVCVLLRLLMIQNKENQ